MFHVERFPVLGRFPICSTWNIGGSLVRIGRDRLNFGWAPRLRRAKAVVSAVNQTPNRPPRSLVLTHNQEREGQKRKERALREVVHSRIMAKKQDVASAVGNPPAHRESAAMNGAQLLSAQSDSSGLMSGASAEGGIASDESAVAEPEIEDDEGS